MTLRRSVLLAALPLALLAGCGKSADAHYADAGKAFAAEDYRAARAELLEALRAAPDDPRLIELQLRTLLRLRDGEGALNLLGRLKRHAPKDPAALARYEAEAALLVGAPDDALALLRQDGSADAARIRAAAHLDKGEGEEAGAAFRQGLEAGADPLLIADYARHALATGDIALAQDLSRRLAAVRPGGLDTLMIAGRLAADAGDRTRAMRLFQSAAKAHPARYEPLLAQAEQHELLDQLPQAARLAEQAEALAPDAVAVQDLQLRLLKVTGQWRKLRETLQGEAGNLQPGSARGLAYAEAQLNLGQPEQARVTFARALLLAPGNRYVRMMLGQAQTDTGDAAGAWATLRPLTEGLAVQPFELEAAEAAARKAGAPEAASIRARRLSPAYKAQLDLAGKAMAAVGQSHWDDAAAAYKALLAGGRDAETERQLAWVLGQAGRYAEAIPVADAALGADPANPELQHLAGWLRLKSGADRAYAAQLLAAAAEGAPSKARFRADARTAGAAAD